MARDKEVVPAYQHEFITIIIIYLTALLIFSEDEMSPCKIILIALDPTLTAVIWQFPIKHLPLHYSEGSLNLNINLK
jgi:hypothetical protein